ncbi:MAG: TetR/AcrR family transcriptional regulator [Deltaproteobacteria bacterium]|nr:TetR/AcrR family transcriptional regulator [Deltaproteobacteria bacterium]
MPTRELQVLGQPEAPRERADALRNRARILDAARTMLSRMPADALCMDALCAEAKVGKGTLYRRFVDKAALLHALLDEDERALQEQVRAAFHGRTRGAAARTQLLHLLGELHHFVVEHADILAAAEASAKPAARWASAPYAWRRSLLALLLEQAGVTPRASVEHTADLLLSSLSAEIALRALRTQGRAAVQRQARAYFEGVLASLVPLSSN